MLQLFYYAKSLIVPSPFYPARRSILTFLQAVVPREGQEKKKLWGTTKDDEDFITACAYFLASQDYKHIKEEGYDSLPVSISWNLMVDDRRHPKPQPMRPNAGLSRTMSPMTCPIQASPVSTSLLLTSLKPRSIRKRITRLRSIRLRIPVPTRLIKGKIKTALSRPSSHSGTRSDPGMFFN